MKPIFLLVCIFFLSSSCTAKNYLYYKHTGYEINNKFKKLQGFNIRSLAKVIIGSLSGLRVQQLS